MEKTKNNYLSADQEQIKIVLDGIDFKRVHKAMVAVGWEWTALNRTPSPKELEHVAKSILVSLCERDGDVSVKKGGFEAIKISGILELRFVFDKSSPLNYVKK